MTQSYPTSTANAAVPKSLSGIPWAFNNESPQTYVRSFADESPRKEREHIGRWGRGQYPAQVPPPTCLLPSPVLSAAPFCSTKTHCCQQVLLHPLIQNGLLWPLCQGSVTLCTAGAGFTTTIRQVMTADKPNKIGPPIKEPAREVLGCLHDKCVIEALGDRETKPFKFFVLSISVEGGESIASEPLFSVGWPEKLYKIMMTMIWWLSNYAVLGLNKKLQVMKSTGPSGVQLTVIQETWIFKLNLSLK